MTPELSAQFVNQLSELKASVDTVQKDVKFMRTKLIDGNGSPSLMIEVDRLKEWRTEQEKKQDNKRGWNIALWVAVITIVGERLVHYAGIIPK